MATRMAWLHSGAGRMPSISCKLLGGLEYLGLLDGDAPSI